MKCRRFVALQVLAGLVLSTALGPIAGHAITVAVQASSSAPGSPVEVQVSLSGGHGLVAGLQTDITWDPACLSATPGYKGGGACASNPAIPKQLSTKIRNASTMRALFLSVSDVEPIQQDGWLFTCSFDINAAATATQCPINLVNLILSDSKGGRLPATAVNGVVRINQPTPQQPVPPTGVAGSSPVPGGPGAAPVASTSEGCVITPARGDAGLLWWLALPLAVCCRPRARQRGATVG